MLLVVLEYHCPADGCEHSVAPHHNNYIPRHITQSTALTHSRTRSSSPAWLAVSLPHCPLAAAERSSHSVDFSFQRGEPLLSRPALRVDGVLTVAQRQQRAAHSEWREAHSSEHQAGEWIRAVWSGTSGLSRTLQRDVAAPCACTQPSSPARSDKRHVVLLSVGRVLWCVLLLTGAQMPVDMHAPMAT